jgi:hypothetical protein
MREVRKSTWRSAMWSTKVRMRRRLKELIAIWVSSILKMSPLNSLTLKAKPIEVTGTGTKHANKSFLSWLGEFSLHFSLGVEGWLWIEWVVCFCWFECFLLFVVVGARNERRSTLLPLILMSLKPYTQSVCGFGYTLLNLTQVLLNHLLTQFSSLKTSSQISGVLLKPGALFGSMEKLTFEWDTRFIWRG